MRSLCILLLIIVSFSSCKKDGGLFTKKWVVSGYMRDQDTQLPLEGGYIHLKASDGATSFFSSADKEYSTYTDKKGYYEIEIERNAEFVRLYIDAKYDELYSSWSCTVDVDDNFRNQNGAKKDIDLVRAGWLRVEFKNTSPFDDKDWFSFDYKESMSFAAPSTFESHSTNPTPNGHAWTGQEVHGSKKFPVPGNRMAVIFWEVQKGGVRKRYGDSVYCHRDAVTNFYVNY